MRQKRDGIRMLTISMNDTINYTKTRTGMPFMYSSAISNTEHHWKSFLYRSENKNKKQVNGNVRRAKRKIVRFVVRW